MKIICVGRNFTEHVAEFNNEIPDEPVLFLKPDTAVLRAGEDFYHPPFSQSIFYECEIYFRIGKEGKYIKRKFAPLHIDGIGVGIDFTARDLQAKLKEKRLPWEKSKAFNHSAPVSLAQPASKFPDWNAIEFSLSVNGVERQRGNTREMLFKIDALVEHISQFFTLKTGDLIFCGTPAGTAKVEIGDRLEAYLEGEKILDFYVR